MTERRVGVEPPAAQAAAAKPHHLGVDIGLIDEEELI